MGAPKAGDEAPGFTLKNQRGEEVSLSDFRGKRDVVVYFYPKAMTPGCTVQACGVRDAAGEFERLGAVVLGISPDEPGRLGRFAEKEGLGFDLLSDPGHATASSYGAWGPKTFMGRTYEGVLRKTFVVGRDGAVRHVLDKVRTKTHHEDVLALLGRPG